MLGICSGILPKVLGMRYCVCTKDVGWHIDLSILCDNA